MTKLSTTVTLDEIIDMALTKIRNANRHWIGADRSLVRIELRADGAVVTISERRDLPPSEKAA